MPGSKSSIRREVSDHFADRSRLLATSALPARWTLAVALLALCALEVVQIVYVRPSQDLPVWDDVNYFVAGADIVAGRLQRTLHLEWMPALQYAASFAWAIPGDIDPVRRFEWYRTGIHLFFLFSVFRSSYAWTASMPAAFAWCLVAFGAVDLLRRGEVYLFMGACAVLVITRLVCSRPLGTLGIATLVAATALLRHEFILAIAPAAAAGVVHRRALGRRAGPLRFVELAGAACLIAACIPIAIAAAERGSLADEIRGSRVSFAFYQKYPQFVRDRNPAKASLSDDVIMRRTCGWQVEWTGLSGVARCARNNPRAIRHFVRDNAREWFTRGLDLTTVPSFDRALTLLAFAGIALGGLRAIRQRSLSLGLLVVGSVSSLSPLLLTKANGLYVLHVLVLGWVWFGMAFTVARRQWIVPTVVAAVLLPLQMQQLGRAEPGPLPRRLVATFLRDAGRTVAADGKVLAEPYSEAARAFALPTLERSVPLQELRLDDTGRFSARDHEVDWVLLERPEDRVHLPGNVETYRVLAARDPLQLIELRGPAGPTVR